MPSQACPLIEKLKQAGLAEGEYTWYGLILGLLCAGFEEGSHQQIFLCQQLLNDAEPLPGTLTAALTSVSLEAYELLKTESDGLLQLPGSDTAAPLRLRALSDLVCGLELGLSGDRQSGGLKSQISDPQLLETLRVFNEISQVDQEGDLDEESLQEVCLYISAALRAEFKGHS